MNCPILTIDECREFQKCTLAYGHFSSIHTGHIRYLKYAKSQGNKLVVAVRSDYLNNFRFNQIERAESLSMLGIVDAIVLMDEKKFELINLIRLLNPTLLILGKEYENNSSEEVIDAIKLQKHRGGSIKFHAGDIQYANTDLLNITGKDLKQKRKDQFLLTCKKQNIKLESLLESIKKWESCRLIVIGDTIIDQYAACEALGMSAEAPVIVLKELQKKDFIGGAAIVASHIRSLGAKCDFISIVGNDNTAEIVKKELSKQDINYTLLVDSSRPTTFKKRYIVDNQKLFRVSRLEDHSISSELENKLISKVEELAPNSNSIVISDFVYGVITEKTLEKITLIAKKYNLLLFGDVQCSSQIGLVTKFKNFSLLCPNEREARLALQDKDSGLEIIGQKLLSETSSKYLIMKLGSEGFIAYDRSKSGLLYSYSFPALSINPVDVAGAGDSVLSVMAAGLSSNQSLLETSVIACCIAALAVEQMGNTPIPVKSLTDYLKEILN